MVCLGFEPWAATLQEQTYPLRYGGTPKSQFIRRLKFFPVPNNPPKIVPVSSSFSFETSRQPNCRLVSADASKGTHVPMTVKRGFTIPSINISITNAFISSERVIYCRSRTASRDLVIRDGWSGGSWYSTSQPTLH